MLSQLRALPSRFRHDTLFTFAPSQRANTMVATPFLSVPTQSTPINRAGPQRALACTITLVSLAAGCFVSLHLLGALNLLFGHPAITPSLVIFASLAGTGLSALLLHRTGVIQVSDIIQPCLTQSWSVRPFDAVKIVFALALLPYAVLFLVGLCSFPEGWDALAYHIDTALKWLQSGTMRVNPTFGWQYSLPSNGELPALIALSLGMPKAVAIGNLFAVVLLATSVHLIAWRMTRQTAPSLLAAVVAITVPMVIFQAFDLLVDMFGTCLLYTSPSPRDR